MKKFWREGEPFVWLTGAALSLTLMITGTLLIVIMVNGLGVFWPSEVAVATLQFLLDNPYITGRTLPLDGGRHLA